MAQLKKILLVDDDDDLREALGEQLVMTEDFDVFEAGDGAGGMAKVKEGIYDLIILDVGLPDMDGRELCKLMRKQGVKSPILMLTGQDSDADTILGLDAGANDYVTKPFDQAELEARCRAVLRRKSGNAKTTIEIGGVLFDPVAGHLSVGGQAVTLRNRELRLLELFLNAPGQIFSKNKLADRLFSYDDDVSENAIEVYIGRLRKHLSASNLRITTLRGLGYRLDSDG